MTINSAFLLKDLVLLAVSVYLLKQDVQRVLARADVTDLYVHAPMDRPVAQ
jgi:hypothetical protein